MRRLHVILGLLAVFGAATQLRAQSPAERSAEAREAWRRAVASDRAGLADSVWADLLRAQAAWPAQPAYTEAVARYAARRGETAVLERALRLLAAQGVGGATATDSAIVATASRTPGGEAALAAVRRGVEPVERSRPRILSPDTMFFAEGLDADPASGSLYITSIRHRAVFAVTADRRLHAVLSARDNDLAAPMGVAFDGVRGVLWVTTAGLPHMIGYESSDSARAELLSVRLADGAITERWKLGRGTGTPGELALTPSGDVLVSDATLGRLYKLRANTDTLETIEHALLRSAQGIAVSAQGDVAWVADWSHGLLHWDLRTNVIAPVQTPDDVTLVGIDGLKRVGDRLIGVQNGVAIPRIVSITLSDDGLVLRDVTTLDRPAHLEGEPTVGTVLGEHYLYVASSAWPFWTENGKRRAGSGALPPVIVRELLLTR